MKPWKRGLISVIVMLWATQVQAQEQGPVSDILVDENPNNVEETLIDFTEFEERIQASGLYVETDPLRDKNLSDLTSEETDPGTLAPAYEIQAADYNYDQWRVEFNSSSNSPANRISSYAKKVTIKEGKTFQGVQTEAGRDARGTGNTVMGVRIRFPNYSYNSNVRIGPPYEFRAYDTDGRVVSRREQGKRIGVMDNVGKIKRMSLDVSGRNFNYGVSIRLKDNFDQIKEYFMGYIHFAGWRRLHWVNPNYVSTVDFTELFRVPLYPLDVPYIKFDSIVVYRPSYSSTGGDFVVYFRKVDMWFDFSIPPETLTELSIDDESNWGILTKRAKDNRDKQTLRARKNIELYRAESQRIRGNAEPKDITTQPQPTQ